MMRIDEKESWEGGIFKVANLPHVNHEEFLRRLGSRYSFFGRHFFQMMRIVEKGRGNSNAGIH